MFRIMAAIVQWQSCYCSFIQKVSQHHLSAHGTNKWMKQTVQLFCTDRFGAGCRNSLFYNILCVMLYYALINRHLLCMTHYALHIVEIMLYALSIANSALCIIHFDLFIMYYAWRIMHYLLFSMHCSLCIMLIHYTLL